MQGVVSGALIGLASDNRLRGRLGNCHCQHRGRHVGGFGCRKLLLVGVVVMTAQIPAVAQPGVEVELGGGVHIPFRVGDWRRLPATPTVDVRAVRWGNANEKWGSSARVLVVSGELESTYVQFLIKYRTDGSSGSSIHIGFGSAALISFRSFIPVAGEVLYSSPLTERVSIRVGVTMVALPPLVHPVGLLAWDF